MPPDCQLDRSVRSSSCFLWSSFFDGFLLGSPVLCINNVHSSKVEMTIWKYDLLTDDYSNLFISPCVHPGPFMCQVLTKSPGNWSSMSTRHHESLPRNLTLISSISRCNLKEGVASSQREVSGWSPLCCVKELLPLEHRPWDHTAYVCVLTSTYVWSNLEKSLHLAFACMTVVSYQNNF